MQRLRITGKRMLPHFSKERAFELAREIDKRFWPIIGTANQSAQNAMLEAYDLLEERGLLKREVKKYANNAVSNWESYSKQARMELGDRWYLWQDMTAKGAGKLEPDVEKLRVAIEDLLSVNGVKDADVRSYIFAANTMVTLAVMIFDSTIDLYQQQTVWDIRENYMPARMTKAQRMWSSLTQLYSSSKEDIDFNKDEACLDALSGIYDRYENDDFINEACGEAIEDAEEEETKEQ